MNKIKGAIVALFWGIISCGVCLFAPVQQKSAFALQPTAYAAGEVAKKERRLVVETPVGEYDFSSEIVFLNKRAVLLGLDEKLRRMVGDNQKTARDASVTFDRDGFCYYPERAGVVPDGEKLKKDLLFALESGEERVRMQVQETWPNESLAQIKKRTQKLAAFTTYFNEQDGGRTANIRLAAAFLDGLKILPKTEFSFNAAVGERIKRRGFSDAKVIENGKFVSGTGGGVCQVSTTLYNAALLSGMQVTARRAHSLRVFYVPPSRDAMVSAWNDLKFFNPSAYPVYLSAKVFSGGLTVTFYGAPTGNNYVLESREIQEIPPPAPEIRIGKVEGEIIKEKAGLKSEGYLLCYRGDALLWKKRLSEDVYAPVRGVIGKKSAN